MKSLLHERFRAAMADTIRVPASAPSRQPQALEKVALHVGLNPNPNLDFRTLSVRVLNCDPTAQSAAQSSSGFRLAWNRFDIRPEPQHLLTAVSAQLKSLGVAHTTQADRVVITPDPGTAMGAFALQAERDAQHTIGFSAEKRARMPSAGASQDPKTRTLQLSFDALLSGNPGVNERHELIHAMVDHLSEQPGGNCAFSGNVHMNTGIRGYEQGFDRSEMITYGDEVVQTAPKLRALADSLRDATRLTPGQREFARALLAGLPTNDAYTFASRTSSVAVGVAQDLQQFDRSPAQLEVRSDAFTLNYTEPHNPGIQFAIEGHCVWMRAYDMGGAKRFDMRSNDPNLVRQVREVIANGDAAQARTLVRVYAISDALDTSREAVGYLKPMMGIEERCAHAERAIRSDKALAPAELARQLHALAHEAQEFRSVLDAALPSQMGTLRELLND